MSDVAIQVHGLGKRYRIGRRESYRALRDSLARAAGAPFRRGRALVDRIRGHRRQSGAEMLWALRDVSFSLERGEVLGVIGRNGAGKSTLLKILCRITAPTEGWAEIHGRVGSLLEVGTGFHPEMTGRENVYLNGAILGMRRAEIERKFDEIVAFAGVERFIDTPVKRYSSGMHMRLAFAVAAHLETEILLVDEVLAVGDAGFQLKCLNKMSEVSSSGKTILFVSHNMEAMSKLCTRAMVIEEGRLAMTGTPQESIDYYLSAERWNRSAATGEVSLREHRGRTKQHDGVVRLTSLRVMDHRGGAVWTASCGEPIRVVLGYEIPDGVEIRDVMFVVTFSNIYNQRIASCRTNDTVLRPLRISRSGRIVCRVPRLPLVPGLYKLTIGCNTEAGFSDGVYDAAILEVTGSDYYPSGSVPPKTQGNVLFDHEWEIE